MPRIRCSSGSNHPSRWCQACRVETETSYTHRERCSGLRIAADAGPSIQALKICQDCGVDTSDHLSLHLEVCSLKICWEFEHQGRYFKEIGYTLFGIVVEVNVCDMRDEFFCGIVEGKSGAETKAALLEMYSREKLPPVCTFTLLIVSSDLQNDPHRQCSTLTTKF